MVEASAVPRQISRTEYITPKTDQEAQTSQIVTERSPETPQSVCAAGKWGYTQLLVTILLLRFLKNHQILHFLLGLPCVDLQEVL